MEPTTPGTMAVEHIRNTYVSRREKNEHYSIASYARDLGLSRPFLSRLLSGQRPLTLKLAVQIANLLNISNEETDEWLADLVTETRQGKKIPKTARARIQKKAEATRQYPIQDYEIAKFKVFSEWYHMAILNLTFVEDFESNAPWIAKRLGIQTFEAEAAITRLTDLGLLELKAKKLKTTGNRIFVDQKKPDLSVRKFHQNMSKKAIQALEDPSQEAFDDQYFAGITMAFDRKKMPEVKAKLQALSKQLMRTCASDEYQDLYHLNLQLFPITKKKKEK